MTATGSASSSPTSVARLDSPNIGRHDDERLPPSLPSLPHITPSRIRAASSPWMESELTGMSKKPWIWGGVQLDTNHIVRAGCLQHFGDQLGSDGLAQQLDLFVLPCIRITRNYGGDVSGTPKPCPSNHHEQLQEEVVYGLGGESLSQSAE